MPNKKILVLIIISAIISGCGISAKNRLHDKGISPEREKYSQAEKAFAQRDYKKAEKLYSEFIKIYKDSSLIPEALLKTGLINETENKNHSLDIYRKIISVYKNSDAAVEASIRGGNLLIGKKEYAKAVLFCNKILNSYISDDDAVRILYVKGNALFYEKKYDETIKIYWKIYELDNSQYMSLRPLLIRSASRMSEYQLLSASSVFLIFYAIGLFKKHYAMLLTREKQFSKAKEVLNDIVNLYPETKTAEEAENEIKLIQNKNSFKIGCILPLSGKFQAFGEMALKGIQLALSKFNSENPGISLRLLVENNNSSEDGSEKAALKLAEKGVSAIIGPFHTGEKAAQVAQKSSIPIMVMTHSPSITIDRDFVFRNFITPQMQARALVTYSKEILNIDSFAILYPDEPYGKKFMSIFWNTVDENNGRITGVEKYDPNSTDYSEAIKKITGLYYKDLRKLPEKIEEGEEKILKEPEEEKLESVVDFQAVFIPDGPAKAGSIAPQLAYFDVKNVIFLGPNLWKNEKLIQYSEGYLNKAVFTSLFYDKSSNSVSKNFTDSFESVFGDKPGFIEAVSYDSAMIVFESARNAESASPSIIRDVIASTPLFQGATGSAFFDLNGECVKDLILLEADSHGIRQINSNRDNL